MSNRKKPTTVKAIAQAIYERGQTQGWKPGTKTADRLNLEAWCGAANALVLVGHKDADHILRVVSLIISVRGYRETITIATGDGQL